MSATLPLPPSLRPNWRGFAAEWWPVLLGLAVLFLPTYADLNRTLWNSEENAHGPIVLLVVLWFFWFKRHALLAAPRQVKPVTGGMLLGFGLLLYALGRSQEILLLEIGSEMLILVGALLMLRGVPAVRILWFPLFFLIFLIPVPGYIVDTLTGPLKHYVSTLVEQALYTAGYPIARNGVMLTMGPYQLLVADACSGLNSMFSLSAMGLLYLYLMQHSSVARTLILVASIWPIAFFANVMRVIILVLITYYFGDEAGQGFLHGFAGILLFVIALLLLFALDALLGLILPDRARSAAHL